MKKQFKLITCIICAMALCLCFSSCANEPTADELWETAAYTEDTTLGDGEKTVYVEVEAGSKSVTFTIKTDAQTVGDALKEHKLISGEEGVYGLYVKIANGIVADYDIDQSYWAFNKNGEYMSTGVDVTQFQTGESFELVYTK